MSQPELESSQGPRATVADIIAADQLAVRLAKANLVSVEQYLHTSYEPDAEYVDGLIEERCVGRWDHGSWQDAIQAFFRAHADEWNVRARPEIRVRVSTTRFRIPDVLVVNRDQPIEQVLTNPPLAVFEVRSLEDWMPRILEKFNDFAEMGVPEIWLIDPETTRFARYSGGLLQVQTHFGKPGERIYFKLSDIENFIY